ncbi:MAG: hypothetical protein ACRET7_08775, partial [Burkholderiales bacterium]
ESELRQARRERDDALRRRGERDLLAAIVRNRDRLRTNRKGGTAKDAKNAKEKPTGIQKLRTGIQRT